MEFSEIIENNVASGICIHVMDCKYKYFSLF